MRITQKDLEILVNQLNKLTNSTEEPWSNGKANIGNYHLSYAYGGVSLHRMESIGGGVSCPLGSYHMPKRELYNKLNAFISGIELAQN